MSNTQIFTVLLCSICLIYSCQSNSQKKEAATQESQTDIAEEIKPQKLFTPLEEGTFTDPRDMQEYPWVKLRDGRIWMAKNLNYKGANSFCFRDKEANCDEWGRIYRFKDASKACPEGWSLPSSEEWIKMLYYYGEAERMFGNNLGFQAEGRAYKRLRLTGESGFNLAKAGYMVLDGYTTKEDGVTSGAYWTSTQKDDEHAYYYVYNEESGRITQWDMMAVKNSGFSCRCIKDEL